MAANKNEFIDLLSGDAISDLQKAEKYIVGYKKHIEDINKLIAKQGSMTLSGGKPSSSASNTASNNSNVANANKLLEQQQKAIERNRLAEIRLEQQREKAFDKYEAQLKKEEAAQAKQSNSYTQLSAQLRTLFNDTASIAAQMFLLKEAGQEATPEYAKLGAEFETMRAKTIKLDDALKKIDSSLGRNQRNVGNYKFDSLNNSIQQILREAPSAAVSLNTFFLAISNNLPSFFDAIQQANGGLVDLKANAAAANIALAAQTATQAGVASAAQAAEESLADQVETVISGISASREQATAIREQVVAHLSEAEATGAASIETVANTEATLVNAGATVEQVAAIDASIIATAEATTARLVATESLAAQTVATTEANAALAAQPGVLKRVASSLFSWNSLLTVGVLLLTLYGKEIIDWAGSLFGANKELQRLEETQKRLNDANIEGRKGSVDAIIKLRENLAIAKDAALSDIERQVALKKLRSEYAYYFKDLTDAQILAGDTVKAENALRLAIEKRAEADRATGVISENKQKLIDLKAEQQENYKLLKQGKERVKDVQTLAAGDRARGQLLDRAINMEAEAREKVNQNLESQEAILAQNAKWEDYILKLRKESIGLDYQEEKAQKEDKLQIEPYVDYYASRYELIRTQLENEANAQKLIIDDEAKSLEHRNEANEEYHKIQLALATEAYAEQVRLLDKNLADEVASLQKRVKDGEIAEKNANGVIYTLRRQYHFDLLKAEEDNSEAIKNVNRSLAESLKGVWQEMDLKKQTNLIDERELENTRSYVAELKNIVEGNEDYQKILAAEKELNEANVGLTQERLQAEERAIEAELAAFPERERNSQAYLELQNKLIAKTKERAEVDKKSAEEQAAAMAKLQKATEDYVKSISSGSLGDFGFKSLDIFTKLDENGKSTFKNLIDGANNTGEKIAVIFKAISDVAKDAIDFLAQNQQAKFDAQYAALEKQYELDQEFNAKGEEAKAELQKQYDERRREIRIKEAKAEKENAIFKAIINTAQGVTSALATANIPLSIIIAALGAAQVASIAGRQIPAYEFGTANHPGGLAWVGDGGRAEIINQPNSGWSVSPSVPTLMNLERGTQVFPDANAFRREIPAVDVHGGRQATAAEIGIEVGKHMPELTSIELTKSGFNSYVIRGSARSKKFDDRISSSGKKFS